MSICEAVRDRMEQKSVLDAVSRSRFSSDNRIGAYAARGKSFAGEDQQYAEATSKQGRRKKANKASINANSKWNGPSSGYSDDKKFKHHYSSSIADSKKSSKCKECGAKGHWWADGVCDEGKARLKAENKSSGSVKTDKNN